MITYEQDPDILRWGLQLFEGVPESNYTYCCSGTDNNTDYYTGQYLKNEHYDIGSGSVENDEYIARALQDQLSQMSVTDGCGSPQDVQQLQTSVYSQNWIEQSTASYGYGHPDEQEELDDRGPSSTCSSPGENSNFDEVWSYSIDHSDEYDLDGEVGKRLNQMVPIPHVPKINGEIPSIDEATLDHQRLLDRLQLYELVEFKVQGDGNCQFRALSDQFYRSPEHHKFVRQQVVNQLKSCRDVYEGCVPMAYSDYLKKMSKSGEWGDHVTLQAAADSYGVKIFVITSFKDTCYIEILPNVQRSKRVVFLSFWAEVHYNSIYPEGDVPAIETKKKKKQWWDAHDKHLESVDNYN